jgi:hypothetical protein
MQTLNPHKTGLIFGTLLGGWHAIWAAFVALGWAQAIVNFVFWMHMIKPVYVIGSFNFWIALILIAVTGAIGYIGGFALAALWSWLHREPDQFVAGHGERLTPVSGQDCRSQC